MQLGARIYRLLKEMGLTQKQLAEKTGLTPQAINNYVRSKGKPSYEAIVKLSEVLGVHPGWFFSNVASGDVVVLPSSPKFTPGGTFVIGHFFPMQHYPPPTQVVYGGIVKNLYSLIFNSLFRWIFYGQPLSSIAIGWQQVENRWLFQLREGVMFHDGTPMGIADVMWSYEEYLRQNPSEQRIEGIEVIDRSFIQLHLKSPCRLEGVAMPFIVPEGSGDASSKWIGTGPFQVVDATPGFLRLARNPYYFLTRPFFEELQIRQYENPQALEAALASGEVHFAAGLSYPEEGFIVKAEADVLRYHLSFVLSEPRVQNRTFRRAIALALDKEALAQAAGLKAPLYSTGPFDYTLKDRVKTAPTPEPELAAQLLKTVEGVGDSVFRIKAYPTVPQSEPLAQMLVQQFRRVGIKAELGEPPHAQLIVRPVDHLENEYGMWSTSDRRNLNGYSNREVDQYIERFRKHPPTDSELRKLRQVIQKEMPDIPLFYYEIPITYTQSLRALEGHVLFLKGLNDIHNWFLDPPAEAEMGQAAGASVA
jgi:ABC-type transport system substrate-binding protein/lambda repressor-like predicted transcriptional regulator